MNKYSWLYVALIALCIGLTAASCQSGSQPIVTASSERLIAAKNTYELKGTRKYSPDGSRMAFVAGSWGIGVTKSWVVVDGLEGKKYDEHVPGQPSGFSTISNLNFSPDGKNVAYVVTLEGKSFVVLNGREGTRYDSVNAVSFSPDGSRVAYFGRIGVKYFIVVDGTEGKKYDPTGDYPMAWIPVFSPDSRRIAYIASADHRLFVVVNGAEQPGFEAIGIPAFSPDSKHLVYTASSKGNSFLVIDGKAGEVYAGERSAPNPIYSPDSQHLAYVVTGENSSFIVLDGAAGKRFDSVFSPTFSSDGRHLAYNAQTAGKTMVVLDGTEGNLYDSVSGFVFSPDSQRFAYIGVRENKCYVVVDGSEAYQYASASGLVFSPDSRRLAFSVQPTEAWGLAFVIDGVEGKKYGPVLISGGSGLSSFGPLFSPDSHHVVYRANQSIVVDATETPVFGTPLSKIIFDSSGSYHYLADKDGDTYLVERLIP